MATNTKVPSSVRNSALQALRELATLEDDENVQRTTDESEVEGGKFLAADGKTFVDSNGVPLTEKAQAEKEAVTKAELVDRLRAASELDKQRQAEIQSLRELVNKQQQVPVPPVGPVIGEEAEGDKPEPEKTETAGNKPAR